MEAQIRISAPLVLMFYDNIIKQLHIKKKSATQILLDCWRSQLPLLTMTKDGQDFLRFVVPQSKQATNEERFRDLIKVIWEMARDRRCNDRDHVLLFFVGVGALCGCLRLSALAPPASKHWIIALENGVAAHLAHANPDRQK